MSNDVIRQLLPAVADLPPHYTGLVLGMVNNLRGKDHVRAYEEYKAAHCELKPPACGKPQVWEETGDGKFVLLKFVTKGLTLDQWCRVLGRSRVSRDVLALAARLDTRVGVKKTLVIIKGDSLPADERTTQAIWELSKGGNYVKTSVTTAFHVRELLTEGDMNSMGLDHLVFMHHPVCEPQGVYKLLAMDKNNLTVAFDRVGLRWPDRRGFVYELPPGVEI